MTSHIGFTLCTILLKPGSDVENSAFYIVIVLPRPLWVAKNFTLYFKSFPAINRIYWKKNYVDSCYRIQENHAQTDGQTDGQTDAHFAIIE